MPKFWARASSSERERAVSMRPGAMLLTLTLGPSSFARHLTRAATPGRSTFEESRSCIGSRTDDEVMKSTEAPSFICGTRVRSSRMGAPKSRRKAWSHWSSVNSSAGPKGGPPALTSTPSSVPKRSMATAATLSTPDGWETSAIHCSVVCSPSSRATSLMASSLRATRRTRAPSATSCSATALPSPLLAPPTTNDLFSRPNCTVVRLLTPSSRVPYREFHYCQYAITFPCLAFAVRTHLIDSSRYPCRSCISSSKFQPRYRCSDPPLPRPGNDSHQSRRAHPGGDSRRAPHPRRFHNRCDKLTS